MDYEKQCKSLFKTLCIVTILIGISLAFQIIAIIKNVKKYGATEEIINQQQIYITGLEEIKEKYKEEQQKLLTENDEQRVRINDLETILNNYTIEERKTIKEEI